MRQDETNAGLTPEAQKRILKHAAKGLSGRQIAEQNDIHVSAATVYRFLREHRRDRAETTKAIVREHLSTTLPSDLEILDGINNSLERMRKKAEEEGDSKLLLQIVDRQAKTIGLKLKYSGADEDDSAQRLIDALTGEE